MLDRATKFEAYCWIAASTGAAIISAERGTIGLTIMFGVLGLVWMYVAFLLRHKGG